MLRFVNLCEIPHSGNPVRSEKSRAIEPQATEQWTNSHAQKHCSWLNITFNLLLGSKLDMFSSRCGILQKGVSWGVAGNSLLPPRAAPTIQTDVQNAALRLWTLLQSRSVIGSREQAV
jgi:hypothetical protein